MLQPRIGMCRGCGKVVKTGWQVVRPMDDGQAWFMLGQVSSGQVSLGYVTLWLRLGQVKVKLKVKVG